MVGAGLITTVPLLLFASAAQRIPLTTIGILQYITPTLQFLLGVLIYKEPFSFLQSIGFGIVWIGLVVFCVESFVAHRALPVRPMPEPGGGNAERKQDPFFPAPQFCNTATDARLIIDRPWRDQVSSWRFGIILLIVASY